MIQDGRQEFPMVAKTIFGLEDTLASELLSLGARQIQKHKGAVGFVGDTGFMYKANLNLRTALRILKPLRSFEVKNEQQLYREIQKINWTNYLAINDTLAIDCVLSSDRFTNSYFLSQKAKDAIVDQFRERFGERPSVELKNPTLRIHLHIHKDTCSVALDTSGESLHKRGYRDKTNIAPINEVLAAGLVLLSGWDKTSSFIDPMCGSGTILIEAALIAGNIPPGYYRQSFAFQEWKDYDSALWEKIYESSMKKINQHPVSLTGIEISSNVARIARENIKLAQLEEVITIENTAFQDYEPATGPGIIVMNPPYGERLNEKEETNKLYESIGDTLKQKYKGYRAWIISSNREALNHVGLHAERKIVIFNGQLECRFVQYNIYEGTKRKFKTQPNINTE